MFDFRTLIFTFCMLLPATSVAALTLAEKAPDFSLAALNDKQKYSLADYAGQVVYIDFWASWCGPCRQSLPSLDRLYRQLGNRGFMVLAINVDAYSQDAKDFLKAYPVSYPVLLGENGSLPAVFGVKGMPTAFLIDKQGKVRRIYEGFRLGDEDLIRKEVLTLLEEES
jgi:thiol-disulfide isomerase/thioredoxin